MPLTQAQKTILKADILANQDPVIIQAVEDGNDVSGAAWYNLQASPDFFVFKSFVSEQDIKNLGVDFAEHLIFTAAEERTFRFLTDNGFDPRFENIRSGLATTLTNHTDTRDNILSISTKLASNIEKLFSTVGTGVGGGDGSAMNLAAILVFEGEITPRDIREAFLEG
jgi:hypothetical protein